MNRVIWQGDYIDNRPCGSDGEELVTVVEFLDEKGKCRARVVPERELPFKPDWQPLSVRGFHQFCEIPEQHRHHPSVSLNPHRVMWNARLPENGAVSLHPSEELRDRFLEGEE